MLLEDDVEALEAALSFVDSFSDEASSQHILSTASLFTGTTGLNRNEQELTTQAKKQVTRRNNRRHEVAYLKNKVQQLTSDLETLRRRRQAKRDHSKDEFISTLKMSKNHHLVARELDEAPHVWQDIAQRQQNKREESERENAKLKVAVETQVKIAKSMENLLLKQIQQQISACGNSSTNYFLPGSLLDLLEDGGAFETLSTCVETTYAELDSVFTTNGLLGTETPEHGARVRQGANGLYLDVYATKLFPFGFEDVATAVWNHFRGNDKHHGELYENATKNTEISDIVMEAFTMESKNGSKCAKFREKQVVKRFVESNRHVVVWVAEGQGQQHKNSPFSSFGFVEKGYVVTKCPASDHEAVTIVQMCVLMSPRMVTDCGFDRTVAANFTEFVLNVVATNAAASQELIENALLDQTLRKRQEPKLGA